MKKTTRTALALLCLALASVGCGDPAEQQNEQEQADTAGALTPLDSSVQGLDVDTGSPMDSTTVLPDSVPSGQ